MRIRHATKEDAERLALIEGLSFPKEEGATLNSFIDRIKYYPTHFWLLEKDGVVVSHVNGLCTNEKSLTDEMYEDASMHDEEGKVQMIFGIATLPEERAKGYASLLMERVIEDSIRDKRKAIVLTCKDYMIPFYEKFGFKNNGKSGSEHGGAIWYEMIKTLDYDTSL